MMTSLNARNKVEVEAGMKAIQIAAIQNKNIFEELMETCKYASLGQITASLFEVGGQYRRNM
jgi:methylmalonyl-CoA mutase